MQNRFVGDIGDFGKYGMLRYIGNAGYKLGVNWYFTDDGEDSAGNLIEYLKEENPGYIRCDEELFRQLYKIVYILEERSVKSVEKSGILPSNTEYFSCALRAYKEYRDKWFQESLTHLSECPVLFLDPDNNILFNNAGFRYDSEGLLYAFPFEIEFYYRYGHSVIIYNHSNRQPEFKFFQRFNFVRTAPHFDRARVFILRFNRKQVRYYLFILRPEHSSAIEKMIEQMLAGPWGKKWRQWKRPHFEKYDL